MAKKTKKTEVHRIYLSDEEYDRVREILANPPKPTPALKEAMRRHWLLDEDLEDVVRWLVFMFVFAGGVLLLIGGFAVGVSLIEKATADVDSSSLEQ